MKEYFSDIHTDPLTVATVEEQGGDWATSWADLMMVMFVLFTVLFVYAGSKSDLKVLFSPETAGRAMETSSIDPLLGLIGNLSGLAESGNVVRGPVGYSGEVVYKANDNAVTVIREGDALRITMRGDVFFLPGNETLQPTADDYLDEIGDIIRRSPGNAMVVGYADPSEVDGVASFGLSARRAEQVAAHLMKRYGMEPWRIAVTGRGAYAPDVPGNMEQSAELNRRVEVILMTR